MGGRDEGKGRARQKERVIGGRGGAGTRPAHLSQQRLIRKINALVKTVAAHVHVRASTTRLCGGQRRPAAQAELHSNPL